MVDVFRMPDVGEGLTEAEIVAWQVAPGDTVTVNQILLEIETAKAVVELPSPYAGTVHELLASPGDTVNVGEPIIAIETGSGSAPPAPAAPATGGAKIGEAGADGRIATLVGYGPRPGSATRRPRPGRRGAPVAAAEEASAQVGLSAAAATAPTLDQPDPRVPRSAPASPPDPARESSLVPLAKPPVRKLAKDLGVDLRELTGSGPGGVITREDVLAAAAPSVAESSTAPSTVPTALPADPHAGSAGGERREPIRGVRKATAAAMVQSAFTAPHVTEFLTVDVTETMALRERLRGSRAFADVKLTPLAFVAKAVCLAARRTPAVNASWDEAAGEIVYYDRVQLGIAAATPRGLMVPKIRDADRLDLHGLAVALGTLTETARAGRTTPADLTGGTITITNVGVFGVDSGTPILNPGEAAILAVGSIKPAPWVVDGELAVRTVCRLALSFDHRLVDGEQGSRFLADVGALLEDPATAMLW
ncbi:dihydrolipoamide acetyltransferase family protein [Pseudonocardia oroxyli]|uniref:Dihydrolipoamide acetyltransferase component of pyruvate dehydrogenase complex n=1 Tax=Pseudonocardia oroxyli TaxID=366584 RepID=A0A1G7LGJ1_PSEOR|nr:dihydrolipoamide acetyltransferase family protein [Pseudonocardia oroxyli]SDF48541.1 pyruvate dehydrogenase E2 component (dihydrolipoamide acetyltransferase) [Pseudonocardia oroxyli]